MRNWTETYSLLAPDLSLPFSPARLSSRVRCRSGVYIRQTDDGSEKKRTMFNENRRVRHVTDKIVLVVSHRQCSKTAVRGRRAARQQNTRAGQGEDSVSRMPSNYGSYLKIELLYALDVFISTV